MLATHCNPEQIEEFLHPPTGEKLGPRGQLVVGWQGKAYRLDIEKSLGSTVPLGETGCAVRLLQYLADFRHEGQTAAVNPAVKFALTTRFGEVVVTTAARQAGELAWDRSAGPLPGDFWAWYHPPDYRHGDPSLRGLLQFAAAADGRLCYRTFRGSGDAFALEGGGNVPAAKGWQRIWGTMNFRFQVAEHLPNAGPGPYFEPVAEDAASQGGPTRAALRCRLQAGTAQQEFWLGKTDEGFTEIDVGGERFAVGYHPLMRDLGFSVTLLRAEQTTDRGSGNPANQSSLVLLSWPSKAPGEPWRVTLNQPLAHRGYKLYQSGFQTVGRDENGRPFNRVTFLVNRDPGLYLKYAGSILLAVGIACMFYMKAYFFGPRRTTGTP
jgi:hypothetical protein